jgi:MYXO-CTERM domain-containing protein
MVRALLPVLLVACAVNGSGPAPVIARPPPDPDRMPTAVLDKQDPGADTSKNPVLSRTSAHYVDNDSQWAGCLRLLACNSGGGSGDASGLLIVIAALAATRRRNRS